MTTAEVSALRRSVRSALLEGLRRTLYPTGRQGPRTRPLVGQPGPKRDWRGPEVETVCAEELARAEAAVRAEFARRRPSVPSAASPPAS